MPTSLKTPILTAASLAALVAGGCGGSSQHRASAASAARAPVPRPGLGGCMLAWNSGAPSAAHRRLSAQARALHNDAAVEQWAAGPVRASTAAGGTITVSDGDCVVASARGVAFVHHGGTWTQVLAASPSDSLYRVVSDAQALPNAIYSSTGLLASTSEAGP